MSGQILVKYEAMQSYVGQMNQLMEDIESSKEEPPEQAGGGQVAERIEQLNESWRMLSSSMKMLTQASKMFMENAAKLFQESDQLILNPETRKVTSEKEYDREVIQEWRDKTGKTAGNIGSQSYKRGNPFYNSGYEGQCTWYCYGRFRKNRNLAILFEKCKILDFR